ncbi:hypothetical protein FPRO04_02924 [Fusarium proliferatum]|nr:hypothetical protein FPRO03_03277 [Fusarium proliferatum]KAG4270943.1 hypothetical protein FPRO04_02924 [Fusarium proliferatum]
MPASTVETPAVALSFANNFWGKEDAGVAPLLSRMTAAKTTCDELRAFYGARASIEEEYSRKLLNLSRKALGSQESGTLKTSLDTVRGEVEQMAKQHQLIGAEMKSELEEPLAAFAGGMKERRKIIQNTVEKLLKVKMQQTQQVNKTRDKYEQECLKIKGYLAQGHMVMGQEERRNKAKLEKTQISLATSNTEYENAVKALEDTTTRWNREWKSAADKFQDLEEERLDFTKSSLWTFANIASTVCVSDDSSCEKIRLSLEVMDVEKDIITFITEKGTGQEIPDAPKYINFCRGDVTDNQSETSEDDNYSVAQFPRSINPAFLAKKKSGGFLKNHSPFRRKSNKDLQSSNRNTWHAPSTQNSGSPVRRPQLQTQESSSVVTKERTQSPEPIDANASLALGVGQNVFPVSTPDTKKKPGAATEQTPEETDPIALALAELKGVTLGKQSSMRMSADHYSGLATPAPASEAASRQASASRTAPTPVNPDVAAAKRGTPPPSYQTPVSRLGVPPPAVTSRAMKEATKKATTQTRSMFESGGGSPGGFNSTASRTNTRATETRRSEPSPSQSVPPSASRPATRTTNHGRGESGSYSASPVSRQPTRATDNGRGEPGSYSSASMPRPGTRGTEMGRGDTGGYSTPPVARSGTKASEMPRSDTRGIPISRPGTRGSDMSRGGSGIYGSSPGSRPGTRGSDMPRATSPAPARSVSPQPPMNDNMSYRSVSPNPYAASQRSPSVMSSPQKHGSAQGYYTQSPQQAASRGPSPSPYAQQNRPGSSYAGSDMAIQLAPVDDPYGSQRSRGSRPASRAMSYYDDGSTRQRSQSVADPSRLYTGDGRAILHYARALYMYQAAIPEELSFGKGDYLAVLRHQDDGWWEAEVHGGDGTWSVVLLFIIHTRLTLPDKETLEDTARVITSKPVQRAVVNTVLLVSTAATLFCTAAIASLLFFQNFLPHEVVTLPLHLQYGSGTNPYGIASLQTPPMKTQQEYDVSLILAMPRSNPNVERGNFMITLHMVDSQADAGLHAAAERHASLHQGLEGANVLFTSRRPALFPYVDPFKHELNRHPVGRASLVLKSLGSPEVSLTAQLRGLRWMMVHYRISTFIALTLVFWAFEVIFMGVAWGLWSMTSGSPPGDADDKTRRLEAEGYEYEDEDTDRAETFPTYGRQQPLKYEPDIKPEADPEQPLSEIPRAGADADDEDEGSFDDDDDDVQHKDSGIGTSYSEEGISSIRRRTSCNKL